MDRKREGEGRRIVKERERRRRIVKERERGGGS